MDLLDPADERGWGPRHTHDPTAVRDDDGTYYLFSTDAYSGGPARPGVQVRRSTDLATWEFHGYALDGVPTDGGRWSDATGLWAPDVVRVRCDGTDEWRMYWSASTFGSRTSAIGLAVARRPTGPWHDRGLVVTSQHETPGPNAIDANAVVDRDGRHWLLYGSFFAGIHVLELDPSSGLAIDAPPGVCVARRRSDVEGAVEGPFAVARPGGGYALLVSYDSLFSTYHVRVGVGAAVPGPYLDAQGHDLTDLETDPAEVGTTILAGHRFAGGRTWRAPGHASVLTDGGSQFLVHHVRDGDDPHRHEVQVRRLVWTHRGWPVVSPQPWAGTREPGDGSDLADPVGTTDTTRLARPDASAARAGVTGPAGLVTPHDLAQLTGRWDAVTFDTGSGPSISSSRELVVDPAMLARTTSHGDGRFTWSRDDLMFDGVVFASWDAVRERPAWSFSGLDDRGRATFGTWSATA